jgi:hypothetical protein
VIATATGKPIWDSRSSGQCSDDCVLKFDADGLLKLQMNLAPGRRATVWTISQEVFSSGVA